MSLSWTIAAYMDRAARECSITPPSSWSAATDTNSVLIKAYLQDTVHEIIERADLNQLNPDYSITGTGATAYALPSDFMRLTSDADAVYENSPNRGRVTPITRNGDWTALLEDNSSGSDRYYRLQGSNIEFFSALPTDAEVTLSYISKNWKTAVAGDTPGEIWTADDDLSLIHGEILQLGVVWRFKRHKRLHYADFRAEYESHLARLIANDRNAGKVSTDGTYRRRGPWDVPVPDFIPPS